MGPVQHPRRRIQRHHLGTGVIDVALAVGGDLRPLHREALSAAAVDRQHVVLAGLHIPHADHGDQAVALIGGEVVGFGEILLEVVELPAVGIELDQLVVADRISEATARFHKRAAGPGAHGSPAIVIERAVAKHLEVLGEMAVRCGGIGEAGGQRETLDRALGDALDRCGGLDAEGVEHGGHHVDGMAILGAHFAPGGDALRPAQDERIAGAAPVGLALPAAEGGVAGVGPAPGVVVEVLRPTDVINGGEILREVFRHIVEELALVHRSGGTALGAGSVVGDHHDHGVVVLTDLLQETY